MVKRERLSDFLDPALSWRKDRLVDLWAGRLEARPVVKSRNYIEIEMALLSIEYSEFICEVRDLFPEEMILYLPKWKQNRPIRGSAIPLAMASFAVSDSEDFSGDISRGQFAISDQLIMKADAYSDEERFGSFLMCLVDVLSDKSRALAAFRPDGLIQRNFWVPDPFYISLYLMLKGNSFSVRDIAELLDSYNIKTINSFVFFDRVRAILC